MRRRAPFAYAAAVLWIAACVHDVNPATGRREVVLMSTQDEQKIDEEQVDEVARRLGIVNDPALASYVDAIGQALAAHSPRRDVDYHFQIIEMDEPNAFAMPGGHIFVSRGLLVVSNSEAELANVIGHEIGHVAARHAAQQDAHIKTLGLSSLLSDLMSGNQSESHANEPLSGNFVLRYARNQEREADRIGLELTTATGVDPSGLGSFLQTLDQLSRLQQGFSMPQTYFSSHPAASERMIETAARAQEHKWRSDRSPLREWAPGRPVATSREAYLAHLDGLAIGRPAAEGVFDGSRFLHAEMGFSQQFPSGWQLLNLSDQVVGISPKRDAVALLQLDSRGDDPAAAAHAYARREGFGLGSEISLQLGGLPAYRARAFLPTSFGRLPAEITWIAYQGMIFRLIAGVQPGTLRSYEGVLRKFSHGFRPMTPEERARITELRLRIAEARPGESLAELSTRAHNEWDPAYTAVVNGLAPAAPVAPGSRIKIAVREPYVPAPPGDTAK
ncbi:MAG TPA: M48 family metalloprotease [Myxococcota bacterium]|nr:M48 family metalloprotease [Myxococcota bacterium]